MNTSDEGEQIAQQEPSVDKAHSAVPKLENAGVLVLIMNYENP